MIMPGGMPRKAIRVEELHPKSPKELTEVMSKATLVQPPYIGMVSGFSLQGADPDFMTRLVEDLILPGMVAKAIEEQYRTKRFDAMVVGSLEKVHEEQGSVLLALPCQAIMRTPSFSVQIPVYSFDGRVNLDRHYKPGRVLAIKQCSTFFDIDLIKDHVPLGELSLTEGLGRQLFEQILREPLEAKLADYEGINGVAISPPKMKCGHCTEGEQIGIASLGMTYFA